MTKFFMIDEDQVTRLEAVMKRLYTETRMNGDEMRDAAHTIKGVVTTVRQIPAPDENAREPAPAGMIAVMAEQALEGLRRFVGGEPFKGGDRTCMLDAGYIRIRTTPPSRGEWALTEHGEKVAREHGFAFTRQFDSVELEVRTVAEAALRALERHVARLAPEPGDSELLLRAKLFTNEPVWKLTEFGETVARTLHPR